ncbi:MULTISPECIES: phage terminase small subunit P27 family [unclassified Lebetimonas]|uniref:phage terminase small subunit P27 family n=1 Tax=unclassified Lebetimonas TaxID=2648158 RepID=UPI000465FC4F|nr:MULTISPECIES: phage terminase small subunit P27 family [unclassified Lebetimonas]
MRGGARPGAGRAKVNDPKLKKIFNRVNGLAKLNKIGKKEEQRIVNLLEENGVLSDFDFALIRAYALAFQEWNEAEAALIEQGRVIENSSGNPIANPYLRIRDNAFKRMFEIAKEMGFSIKSREKMKDWLQKEEDEFAKFLFDN